LHQLAKPVLRLGETDLLGQPIEWRQVKTHTMRHLLLYIDQNESLEATIQEGAFWVANVQPNVFIPTAPPENSRQQIRQAINVVSQKLNPAVSLAITELLLKAKEVTSWNKDSEIKPDDLTPDDAVRMVKKKPALGGIALAYKVHGPSKQVKDMILDWCNQEDLRYSEKSPWIGNDFVVELFDDLEDLVKSVGNDGAQWFADVLSGKRDLEYYDAEGDVDDRVRALEPEALTCLGAYLQRTYELDIEDNIDDYDPSDLGDVLQVLELVNDDEVKGAADRAAETGMRHGAESKMHDMLIGDIKGNPHFAAMTKDGKLGDKNQFDWDAPWALVVPIEEIIQQMGSDPDDLAYEVGQNGWASTFEAKIELEEPSYGFNDFDDDAANEDFKGDIYDLCHEGS